MDDGPTMLSFIMLYALGALVGLLLLFWVIRAAVISGMKHVAVWQASPEFTAARKAAQDG